MNDWLGDAFALPTRDGQDVGGAQERTMQAFVQGVSGIRTVEELNPDGTITTLRTRAGWPTFETTDGRRAATPPLEYIPRGFVAKVPGGRAILFDPYTLEILQENYTPALNTYTVQGFASAWNRAPGDVYADVVLFEGTKIKVNAKDMPSLGITANHAYPAVPHVIERDTADDRYGNAERNGTEKRVFAVGRYRVTSWGSEDPLTVVLEPASARPYKSVTLGQHVEPLLDMAFVAQIYFTGSWWADSLSQWRFSQSEVQMMLAAPYLTLSNTDSSAELPQGGWGLVGENLTGTEVTALELPSVDLMLIGSPVLSTNTPYSIPADGHGGSGGMYVIFWPWTGTYSSALQGEVHSTYLRTQYSGDADATTSQGGVELTYRARNYKDWDVSDEYVRQASQTIVVSDETYSGSGLSMGADISNLWWGGITDSGFDINDIKPHRGPCAKQVDSMVIPGTTVTSRNKQKQSGQFSVTMRKGFGEDYLISIDFIKEYSFGEGYNIYALTGWYDSYLLGGEGYAPGWGTIYGFAGVGLGGNSRAQISPYVSTATDNAPIYSYYYNPSGHSQDPVAATKINEKYNGAVSKFMGQTLYDSEDSSGHVGRLYYTGSVVASKTVRFATLSFHTKDYIFYDDINHIYISVESDCYTSEAGKLSLNVQIVVNTPWGYAVNYIGFYNFTFSDILKEQAVLDTGLTAVPSPQLRAMFVPLYREQGSFKGIHYTTDGDLIAGASPYCGINFVLNLQMYPDLSNCNADNLSGQQVYFVPFNLLEALYLYIFSQESGVAVGNKYPVSFPDHYNMLRDDLFSVPVRVAYRNGVQDNWTDGFGPDFAAVGTVSLHRT